MKKVMYLKTLGKMTVKNYSMQNGPGLHSANRIEQSSENGSNLHDQVTNAIEEITPEIAKEYLKCVNPDNQRKHSHSASDHFARMIRNGTFDLTHQGIAFDYRGDLVDGQHRLHGIIKADMPVRMFVARNLGIEKRNSDEQYSVFAAIDRGYLRNIQQMLRMHGITTKASAVKAICSEILTLSCACMSVRNRRHELPDILNVIEFYEYEIFTLLSDYTSEKGFKQASVAGAFVYAMKAGNRNDIMELWRKVKTGENIKSGEPAYALRNWILKNRDYGGSKSIRTAASRVTLLACMKHESGDPLTNIHVVDRGFLHYSKKQLHVVSSLLDKCGFTVSK